MSFFMCLQEQFVYNFKERICLQSAYKIMAVQIIWILLVDFWSVYAFGDNFTHDPLHIKKKSVWMFSFH